MTMSHPQPHLFVHAQLMIGSATLIISLIHLFLGFRGIRRSLNIPFALASLLATAEAFTGPGRYLSLTVEDAVHWSKLSWGAEILFGVALVWFARAFAGIRDRRIPLLISSAALVPLIVNWWLPYGFRFRSMPALKSFRLPWGDEITALVGDTAAWLVFLNLLVLCMAVYLGAAGVRLWRTEGARNQALLFTVGVAPFLLLAAPHGFAVISGWVRPPVFYVFGFFCVVLTMSYGLIQNIVRSFELDREVDVKERRWRTLLDNFSLLALGCNREGLIEYVNPFLVRTTGFGEADLLGRPWNVLFPTAELPTLREVFRAAMKGEARPYLQTGVVTRSDGQRQVIWSTILLHGTDNRIEGTLSVGSDITERVQAELARDQASAQLAAMKERLEQENQYLKLEYLEPIEKTEIIGESDAIRYVLHKISQVAATDVTVLIEGETGVGKELVARAIHKGSPRSKMPFIRVNCAALPSTLIDSELFGHEKGAFTGADRARQGRFELADGGSLFLDEIGELPLDVQSKLLRVLQEDEFDRVGGTKTLKANVRLITATNRSLRKEVDAGRFREDLYYRILGFPITVPPLRERRSDIPVLIECFTQRLSRKHGRSITEIPVRVVRQLTDCDWRGNVRELETVIERAVITSRGQTLSLPQDFSLPRETAAHVSNMLPLTLEDMERNHIVQVLQQTRGRISGEGGAAQLLGINPSTLRSRMVKLGIHKPG
jgi:PAS domain S-box-containing protein